MIRCLPAIVFLFSLLAPLHAEASGVLRVNTSIKPPFSTVEENGFFDILLDEIGRRLGREIELVRQPPERALRSIDQGISDMELPRIAGLETKYTNLVMVDEKVIDYKFVAFSRSKEQISTWNELEGRRVGYLIGWKIFENNVPASAKVTKLRRPEQMLDMLHHGRLDIALYECYAGWSIVRRDELTSIKECADPLAMKPMYIYLNKRHSHLAPVIALHLKEMKADGTYERIFHETLGEY